MDPQPLPLSASITTSTASSKLRLMCSYGGHIIPRSAAKSLYYAGGDTRIITVPTTNAGDLTLTSLSAHLASRLNISYPFVLKYQLPDHDLDSLISVSTDEDLLIMLDEHRRLSTPSRIRLFLFAAKCTASSPESGAQKMVSNIGELLGGGSELKHPKTESWFVDALKSAKIMQCEGSHEISGGSGDGGGLCGAESLVLETNSSFGSTSSSVSSSNLPAKFQVDDSWAASQDGKVKIFGVESTACDNSIAAPVFYAQHGNYQDPIGHNAAKVSSNPFESDTKFTAPATGVDMNRLIQVSEFPLPLHFDQPPHQQLVHDQTSLPQQVYDQTTQSQFIHNHPLQPQYLHTVAPQYLPQSSAGVMPMSPIYLMNSPGIPLQQQQQLYYQANQPQQVYLVPVGQPYNLPEQSGLINNTTTPSDRPPLHPTTILNTAHMLYKVSTPSTVPEVASQVYRTVEMGSAFANVPQSENHEQAGLPQISNQLQSIRIASVENSPSSDELNDDPARTQIYKSQPPAPMLPSHYQTMGKATTVLLSEASAKLHAENF
ncbi:hypothetical protein K2173_001232 [Erythroxylum novogranatense]|uniref:PB1 domain-containing protein n=1 Tax=Erythroxylum novogranatense TaxID=1862640 RepID=A0AAV8T469_9ROSI|nr:hypothetical protein K2173_001232 [Erythroxylum novogranatense]